MLFDIYVPDFTTACLDSKYIKTRKHFTQIPTARYIGNKLEHVRVWDRAGPVGVPVCGGRVDKGPLWGALSDPADRLTDTTENNTLLAGGKDSMNVST